MTRRTAATFLVAATALVAGASRAEADLVLVTDHAQLGANDHVFWGNLAPPGSLPDAPATVASWGGVDVTAGQAGLPNFGVLRQDGPRGTPQGPFGWGGNFSEGETLLSTANGRAAVSTEPLVLDLAAPASAAGAGIDSNSPGRFVARIEAFDAGGRSLGAFEELGETAWTADGSAIFLGVRSDAEDIRSVRFSITDLANEAPFDYQAFAISRFDFASSASVPGTNPDAPPPVPQPEPIVTPEPATWTGLALGGLALAGCGWQRRRRLAA